MIAHVAAAGEGRGRVVLQISAIAPSRVLIEAAVRVARAFESELESLFIEDAKLFDIAGFPFAREISLSGRYSRALSPELIEQQCRSVATAISRKIGELARLAEVPLHQTVVRDEPVDALAQACAQRGPWNVVALAEPLKATDSAFLGQLFAAVPGTTGLILVGPNARRSAGRTVAIVEDIADLDAVLRTGRRLHGVSSEERLTLLLAADADEEALLMDSQARLAIGEDEAVELVRARVEPNEPAVVAEIIRRLEPGFVVTRYGGIVMPASGNLRPLAAVLECPIFLMR